ncbi:unnamed protein product [Diplocarpon coronariae]
MTISNLGCPAPHPCENLGQRIGSHAWLWGPAGSYSPAAIKVRFEESNRVMPRRSKSASPLPVASRLTRWSTRSSGKIQSPLPAHMMACNQEVLHSQLVDVHAALNHSTPSDGGWAHMGVGRDDGKQAGGYSPIFYRPSMWKLQNWKTRWPSPTPEDPSTSWDAGNPRVVTIGTFAHVHSSPKVAIPCTLFDEGSQSRRESVRLILAAFDALTVSQDLSAVLLAGDLNSPPTDESYQDMMSQESTMEDVCLQVPTEKRHGDERTHTSFGCADSDGVTSRTYGVLTNRFDDGVCLSDHRACVADIPLELA